MHNQLCRIGKISHSIAPICAKDASGAATLLKTIGRKLTIQPKATGKQ